MLRAVLSLVATFAMWCAAEGGARAETIKVVVDQKIVIAGMRSTANGIFEFDPFGKIPSDPIPWKSVRVDWSPPGCSLTPRPHVIPMTTRVLSINAAGVNLEINAIAHTYVIEIRCEHSSVRKTVNDPGASFVREISFVDQSVNVFKWWSDAEGNYGEDTMSIGPLCKPDSNASSELLVKMPMGSMPPAHLDETFTAAQLGEVDSGLLANTGFYGATQNDALARSPGLLDLKVEFVPANSTSTRGCVYVRAVTARFLPIHIWVASELSNRRYEKARSCLIAHESGHANKFRSLADQYRNQLASMLSGNEKIPTAAKPKYSENLKTDKEAIRQTISDVYLAALGLPADRTKLKQIAQLDSGKKIPGQTRLSLNPYAPGSYFAASWSEDRATSDAPANYQKIFDTCGPWPPP